MDAVLAQPGREAPRRAAATFDPGRIAVAPPASFSAPAVALAVFSEPDEIEGEWRRFQRVADCTPFQSYEWLSTWRRTVGRRAAVAPAIVEARDGNGELLLLLPLAVERGRLVRRLTWLGQELSDYNAPLLAPDLPGRFGPGAFPAFWRDVRDAVERRPDGRHDLVSFTKMPARVGAQPNPFLRLPVRLHPSGAYATGLAATWEAFYESKRTAATRGRDRGKRKRLERHGPVRVVTASAPDEARRTLDVLMRQKAAAFARMGVGDIFARDGWREFFRELATDPDARRLVHVSRLEVGDVCAAATLGLVFRGCHYHVLASYDDGELSAHSPGALHLRELMRGAVEAGLERFDFTVGDEPYKREWSDAERPLHDHSSAVTLRGRPAAALAAARRTAKRLVKRTPVLWRAASRARAAAAAAFRRLRPAGRRAADGDRSGEGGRRA